MVGNDEKTVLGRAAGYMESDPAPSIDGKICRHTLRGAYAPCAVAPEQSAHLEAEELSCGRSPGGKAEHVSFVSFR
jgi:hypothetical protein